MKPYCLSLVAAIFLVSFSFSASAQYPPGFSRVEVVNGMTNPTAMAIAPDGRIFICQQNGALIVVKNGVKLPTPAIQLSVNTSGERGLVGITLHPQFSTNGIIYLYYTLANASRNRVSRFTLNGDVLNPASEQIIFDLDPLTSSPYHNGGAMHFWGDKLFIAVGDNSHGANAQNLETTKGKLLRINANGSIPGDNPYYAMTNTRSKNAIWATGLRNPFTFDIQPGTGRIFVNDVGQEGWEEVNDATVKGRNFGWPSTEGKTTNPAFNSPFYAYAHGTGDGVGCAITGGTFFNPPNTNYPPSLLGTYFFLDYCNSWINYIDFSSGTAVRNSFATNQPGQMLAIDVGIDGNLYFLSRAGRLYRLVYNNTQKPTITDQPDNVTVSPGQTASFTVAATGAIPMTYQWKKDGADISGATSSTYSKSDVQPGDAGNYTVVVTNAFGSATSNTATLAVTAENTPPTVMITAPAMGSLYRAGETIAFAATGSDAEDGILPPSAFTWTVEFHHAEHYHDSPPIATGAQSGTYTIPTIGETAINVFYRLIATVTDSQGLTASTYVDIQPNISIMALQSSPTGLSLTMDGQPYTTLKPIRSVEGVQRTIGVVSPQVVNGTTYTFSSWAHGGTDSQTLPTPIDNTTYTANFSSPLTGSWNTTDIGKQNIFGSASFADGTFTLTATGRDIYNNDDHFRFVYQPVTGDCDIRARVTSLTNTHAWAKAGVMVRETLQPNSRNAMALISPASGTSFQRRVATGGPTVAVNGAGALPYWVRLVRSGNTLTAYSSTNGTSWTLIGTPQSVAMNSTVYVGLAMTSHNSNTVGTATFTDVSLATGGTIAAQFENASYVKSRGENLVHVYPSPAGGDVIYVKVSAEAGPAERIQLVNALGQVIRSTTAADVGDGSTHELDVRGVKEGLYFVKVRLHGGEVSRTIVRTE